MTFQQKAELIADFIEVIDNRHSPLTSDPRLYAAIKAYNDTYSERRVHGFSEAIREAWIAGLLVLL